MQVRTHIERAHAPEEAEFEVEFLERLSANLEHLEVAPANEAADVLALDLLAKDVVLGARVRPQRQRRQRVVERRFGRAGVRAGERRGGRLGRG